MSVTSATPCHKKSKPECSVISSIYIIMTQQKHVNKGRKTMLKDNDLKVAYED